MKKHILSFLAMLVLLSLSACFPGPEYDPDPEPQEPPEPYYCRVRLLGDDSDTIGISIGGGDYNKQQPLRDGTSRALTNEMAQAFHDFFEVVFISNNVVARTTWDVGETPELRGVRGKRDGDPSVNYAEVSRGPGGTTPAAVLFAGSKADKTLLAVGRLTSANGDGTATEISNNTTEVIFTVTAITAGAGFTHATSSFRTDNANGATTFYNYPASSTDGIFIHYVDKDKKRFPCYRLRHGATTNGEYTFSLFSGNFSDYVGTNGAIVLAGGWNCEVRQPRYFLADGYYQTSSIFPQAIKQGSVELINMGNANKQARDYINAGFTNIAYFVNPVTFAFDTTNSPDGSIFALTFEIMVYNLTPRPTTMAGSTDAEPVKWRLSTGTGTKWLDLDDGKGGEGGAILLGSSSSSTVFTTRLDAYNWQ